MRERKISSKGEEMQCRGDARRRSGKVKGGKKGWTNEGETEGEILQEGKSKPLVGHGKTWKSDGTKKPDNWMKLKDQKKLIWGKCGTEYGFINAPVMTMKTLASPNQTVIDEELSIPEQTATGKGTSNPLMAGSLPKTTKPT
ncbi:hypothetical protein Tco_0667989 [Tanacetum coccineum]